MDVLANFCDVSGQKINSAKSKVAFSPNVSPEMCDSLCEILGVAGTNDLGKYLGFPLKSNARNSGDFNFVVEKVQVKLSS